MQIKSLLFLNSHIRCNLHEEWWVPFFPASNQTSISLIFTFQIRSDNKSHCSLPGAHIPLENKDSRLSKGQSSGYFDMWRKTNLCPYEVSPRPSMPYCKLLSMRPHSRVLKRIPWCSMKGMLFKKDIKVPNGIWELTALLSLNCNCRRQFLPVASAAFNDLIETMEITCPQIYLEMQPQA